MQEPHEQDQQKTQPKKLTPRKSARRWIAAATVVVLLALLAVLADARVGAIFQKRLAAKLHDGCGADLEASSAWYLPPVGVVLRNVRLTKVQGDGVRVELFDAARVVLKLQHRPEPNHDIVITRFDVQSPHVTIRRERLSGAAAPQSTPPPTAFAPPPKIPASPPAPAKFVQRIILDQASISNGQLQYLAPGADPISLDKIALQLHPSSGAGQVYQFAVSAAHATGNSFQGSGSFDLDHHVIAISELSVRMKIGAILSGLPLPQAERARFAGATAGGILKIHAAATFPLDHWREAIYHGAVQLQSGQALVPKSHLRLADVKASLQFSGAPQSGLHIKIENIEALSGKTLLDIDGGELATTVDGTGWKASDLLGRLDVGGGIAALDRLKLRGRWVFTGSASGPMHIPRNATALSVVTHDFIAYPRDVSIQPYPYPIPVDHINGGPVTFRGGVVRFANLNAEYGGDQLLLDQARITLDDPRQNISLQTLRRQIRIDDITGALICRQPGPAYPATLGKVIAKLRPSGAFAIGGGSWYAINRKLRGEPAKPKSDFFFRISTAGGAFALTKSKAPLTAIFADATVSPLMVDITRLRAKALGGAVMAHARITPGRPLHYEGVATFYNARLTQAWKDLGIHPAKPVTGVAYVKIHASGFGRGGRIKPMQTLAADGEFEIVDGNFGNILAIRAAAAKVSHPDQPLDGQAAGLFSIRDETVTFDNCAVGNPLFGLQGSGTIKFNKSLDFNVVAAPLGDWSVALKRSHVPIIDNIGSSIAGGIQQLFDGAQRAILWDIHITGSTKAPKVDVTPAPVITESLAAIFGQMIQNDKNTHLIDQIRPRPAIEDAAQTAASKLRHKGR